MHFRPFIPVQFCYLRGTRAHEVPASTAQKILRSYLAYIWLALLNVKWYFRELPFERYQTGSLSHSGWGGIPETYCIRENCIYESLEGGACLYLREWWDFVRIDAGVKNRSSGMSIRPWIILKNMTSWFLVCLDSSVSHSRWSNFDVTLLVT